MLFSVFTITAETFRLISESEDFKGQWRMTRSLSSERLAGLRRVSTTESVESSTRVEGSKHTDRQLESLLGRLHVTEFETGDALEVVG